MVDKPVQGWSGPTGYVNKELIKEHVGPKELGDKIKIFVCGPPGQVAAVSGKKDGMKQGQLGGVLKDLGYTEDQVIFRFFFKVVTCLILPLLGLQVLEH